MARYDMLEKDTAIGTRWSGVTRMTGLKAESTESPLVCLFRVSPPIHLEIKSYDGPPPIVDESGRARVDSRSLEGRGANDDARKKNSADTISVKMAFLCGLRRV